MSRIVRFYPAMGQGRRKAASLVSAPDFCALAKPDKTSCSAPRLVRVELKGRRLMVISREG